jgi:hypothetical protein
MGETKAFRAPLAQAACRGWAKENARFLAAWLGTLCHA